MCFCATASFAASTALVGVGVAVLARTKDRAELPLSSVPLFYAAQQAIEGALWVSLRGDRAHVMPLTITYMAFALFWWPFFLPVAAWCAERDRHRRRWLAGFLAAGTVAGGYLYGIFLANPTPAIIEGDSISHTGHYAGAAPFGILYVLVTVGVGFASTCRRLRIFCALGGASLVLTALIHRQTAISTWCFFAAVLSVSLLFGVGAQTSGAEEPGERAGERRN